MLRVDPSEEQDWKRYAGSLIVFSALFWVVMYVILRTQTIHPWNHQDFHSGTWNVTFNTISSFVSNTNWQYYGGETTMTYFSQMAGLTVQNFVSAAVGIAVLIAMVRGIRGRSGSSLGNFWQDLVRTLLYVLLPLSFIGALVLVSQGVIQNLSQFTVVHTLAGGTQTLALGPTAGQIAIKQLGTNGGGFFNTNSSFPFENATALSNFVEMLFIMPDPGLAHLHVWAHGRQPPPGLGDLRRHGGPIRVGAIGIAYHAEQHGTPAQHLAGVTTRHMDGSTGGNLEGKEQRFGIADSALWTS